VSLDDLGIPYDRAEDEVEIFENFEENALAKARWFARQSEGRPVVADDSGLAVDALNGGPGVRSKRWSGRDDLEGEALDAVNNELLLRSLAESGAHEPWTARYVCAAACAWPGGQLVVRGECEGVIVRTPRGANGFGYDPHFLSHELHRTFAEASRDEKAGVSHRGRAIRALVTALAANAWWRALYS
jgi:XTP/dITP diphosphohydrolase